MSHLRFSSLFAFLTLCLSVAGCSSLASRPSRHLSYAEAAFQAAVLAGAETTQPNLYQLSKDALQQARAAYRVKNFKRARQLAVKARRAAEDAEYKALQAAAGDAAAPPAGAAPGSPAPGGS